MSRIADMLRANPVAGRPAETPAASVQWGSYTPDTPDLMPFGNQVNLSQARNVTPREDGSYGPVGEPSVVGNALDFTVKGAISLFDQTSTAWTFAGDGNGGEGNLYESNDYQYVNVNRGPGTYSIASEEFWDFAEFDTRVIATSIGEPVQSKIKGVGGNFADLITGTNKPQARYVATIANFVFLGNISDATDGLKPNRVWWSGFRDPTTFDPDTATQSDFEDLPDGGEVQALVGGQEYGVILQTNHIRRVTYRGDAAIFDFDPVDRTRGTPIPRSVAARGRILAYIAEEGFMLFDGLTSVEIGDAKTDRTFWRQFDVNNKNLVSTAIDPEQKLIAWAYPAGGSALPNKISLYNYKSGQWATIDVDLDMITTNFFLGINVDTPDPRLADIDNSVWSNTSLDSNIFKGGALGLSLYNRTHEQATFDGPPLAMRMESKDMSLFTGQAGTVDRVRPFIEGTDGVTVCIGVKGTQGGGIAFLDPRPKAQDGLANFRDQTTKARYHRICVEAAAGTSWNKASGFQIYGQERGIYIGD